MGNMKRTGMALIACLLATGEGVCETAAPAPAVEKLPLYEYGIIGLAATIPHYRGSDEYETYAFPLPYFVYRGEVLKADRDGVRGIFWKYKNFETDISLSGNPPSENDEAREGMPDLDAMGELGPALNYYFYRYGERNNLYFQANLRGAFAIDFDSGLDISYEGVNSTLALIFNDSDLLKDYRARFHVSGGFQFADDRLHSYFYEVAPRYATPTRRQYEAEGGYSGFYLAGSVVKDLTAKLSVSGYARWMNVDGAVFEDSPLVETTNNVIVGALVIWKFGESDTLVEP